MRDAEAALLDKSPACHALLWHMCWRDAIAATSAHNQAAREVEKQLHANRTLSAAVSVSV